MRLLAHITILLTFYGFSVSVLAQNKADLETSTKIEQESLIERGHRRFSEGIISLSRQIDSLLGSDMIEDEKPNSSLKLRFSSGLTESEGPQYKFRLKSRLVLPRTQKRFHLVLQNLKDNLAEESVDTAEEEFQGSEVEVTDTIKESEFSAALRYVFLQKAKQHIHTDAGVKFKIPLDPFVKARARQSVALGASAWELEFKEGAEWFQSTGMAYGGSFSFLRKLGRDFWIEQSNVARWTDETSMYSLQNGISLTQVLHSQRTLTYYFSGSGTSDPSVAIQSYTLGISFRTWIFWRWLNFELTPFGSWSRPRNFSFQPGIVARLEAIIGNF